jgi:RNA polymerase primary sigma factor
VIQSFKESVPLDTFNEEKGEGIINPSLHYEGNSILDRVTSLHLSQNVAELLTVLTPQEREIIKLRFGIGKRSDHTLAEIGDKFNLSRERIRQILNVALDKLKKPHYLMELREFAELS